MLPGNLQASPLVRRIAGATLGRNVRREARPGESLPLLGADPPGEPPAWAGGGPIGTAVAALQAAAATGGALLRHPTRALIDATVARWDGTHPPLAGDWLAWPLAVLPEPDRPGARLALLAALAPYRITDADVAAWRAAHPTDADLIRVLAFGAMTAVDRIQAWTTATWPPSGEAGHQPRPTGRRVVQRAAVT